MTHAHYLVVGLGQTGHSIARYLQRRGASFSVFDTRKKPGGLEEFSQTFPAVEVFLQHAPKTLFDKVTALICSPGVALEEPVIVEAKLRKIPIYGDIECLAKEVKVPVIAITGTNGKSTVTTLVGEMAKFAGLKVAVAGNIGLPVLDILDVGVKYDAWILELSSFQLDLTHSLAPLAATILNITPDHLDRHHTLEAYIASKQRVYQQAQTILFNRDDRNTAPLSAENANLESFGFDNPAIGWGIVEKNDRYQLTRNQTPFMDVDAIKIKGRHNWVNALAACSLAAKLGVSLDHMVEVLTRFPGLAHRAQWVRRLHDVDWINDSKGTNVGATQSAIAGIGGGISGKIVLIAGGQGKGADFSSLSCVISDFARAVILIGEDAAIIEAAINGAAPIHHAASLKMAITQAEKLAQAGDVVLLSPACASFDMFRDFNHRGDEFMDMVKAL